MVTVAGSDNRVGSLETSETVSGVLKVPPSVSVPAPASVCPSQPEAGKLTASVPSSSMSVIVAAPLVQLSIWAVTVIGRLPSITWSSSMVTLKLAEVCPAGMVTVAGTVRPVVSLEDNWTTTAFCAGVLQVTVPAPASTPAVSSALAGRVTAEHAVTIVVQGERVLPGVHRRSPWLVITIASGPYNSPLSMIVRGNGAEVSPAGIVTVAGAVTRLGSLEATLTARSLPSAAGMLTLPGHRADPLPWHWPERSAPR